MGRKTSILLEPYKRGYAQPHVKKLARKSGGGMHAAAARSSKSRGDSKSSANQKKNIPQKRNRAMNNTSGSKKKSRRQTKTKHRPSAYVGIDLHKNTLQIEVQDSHGNGQEPKFWNRMNVWPFYRLRKFIEYKAGWERL